MPHRQPWRRRLQVFEVEIADLFSPGAKHLAPRADEFGLAAGHGEAIRPVPGQPPAFPAADGRPGQREFRADLTIPPRQRLPSVDQVASLSPEGKPEELLLAIL